MKKLKEFYWVVQQEQDHPLWPVFIKWLNKEGGGRRKYSGKNRKYYGFIGHTKATDSLSSLPKQTQILTMDLWKSLYQLETISQEARKLFEDETPVFVNIKKEEEWEIIADICASNKISYPNRFRKGTSNHFYIEGGTYVNGRSGLYNSIFVKAGFKEIDYKTFLDFVLLINANR